MTDEERSRLEALTRAVNTAYGHLEQALEALYFESPETADVGIQQLIRDLRHKHLFRTITHLMPKRGGKYYGR